MSEQWLEDLKKKLAKHEGSSGRKKAIEGGGSTRGFGITSISDGLKSFLGAKGLNAEEMNDRDLFNEYVDYEAQRAEKDYPNWNQMPDPLKAIVVDMYYNAGGTSNMPSFNKAIKNNNWAEAADQTLDVVSANDPKTNESAVLRGLANRRVEFYNELAKDIGKPTIDDFTITPSEVEGKKTTITYNTADGPKVFNFRGSIHSASGSYDESKKKSEVTEKPQTTETIVSRETQPPIPSLEVPEEVDPLSVTPTTMETPEEVDPLSVQRTALETPEEVDPLAVSPKFQPQTVVYDPPVDVPKLQREIASIYRMDNQADTIQRNDLYNEEYFSFVQDRDRIWEAAWRQFAPYESLRRFVYDTVGDYEDDPDYDPAGDKRIPKDSLWRFRDSGSFDETTVLLERLKNDLEDMSVLQSSDSTIPSAVAAFSSPSTLAPLAPLKLLRSTSSLRRFVGGGAFSAAVTAPEELLMAEELQTRDASHAALSLVAISLIGGSLNAVAGGPARSFRRTTADDLDDTGEPVYRSAGASANPERARETAFKTMEQDALKETGVGLEGIPWNPVNRLTKSENPFVRQTVSELVDFGGMMQKKVDQEIAQTQSAETNFRTRFIPSLVESIKNSEMQYLKYRGINVSDSGIKIKIKQTTSFFNDIMKPAKRRPYISNIEFRVRVGKAMRRGDKDAVQDAATPFVEQAAKGYRKQLELLKDEATRLRMFERQILGQIKTARAAGLVDEVDRLEKALAKIQAEGVTVNTALSYLPRVYRIDKIMNNPELFISKVSNWAVRTKGMNRKDANLFANDVFDTVTNSRPFLDLADGDTFDFVVKPGSIKQRTLEIPDEEIEEFLESDVEVLIKNQTFNMGRDIELTRAFGDIDMKDVIDELSEEWTRIIEKETNPAKRKKLSKMAERDIKDIRALRDRVRGTYGAAKDPHAITSRFIRSMKSINVIVGMGGGVIASIPDVARTVMVEGFTMTNEKGLRHLFKSNQSTFKKLMKDELNAAGVAADAVLGLRASAFADMSDLFGSRYTFERKLNQSAGLMFVINGMNLWNEALKMFAGTVTALRMTKHIMQDWSGLSKANKEKFLKNGIDQQMHLRMRMQIEKHGEVVDGEFMPNTANWTDQTARQTFRNALNQNVDRIIVTPGAGDRALWTSRELGSAMTQFKSYGQGSMVRMTASGLQERDGAFWQGAFLLVGLGAMVNEIKRLQYGLDNDETFEQKLFNAVDRSGILGWFADVNNAFEKVTDYKMGLGPMLGTESRSYVPEEAKLSSIAGPSLSNILTASSVAADVLTFNADQKTLNDLRFITPGSNLPYLDPIYDGVFGQ